MAQQRIVVTKNFTDYATLLDQRVHNNEPAVPVALVRQTDLPRRGALAVHLGELLDTWATGHPDPYLGPHRPP